MTISLYVGDTAPSIQDTIKQTNSSGALVPLPLGAAVDVRFRMRSAFGSTPLIDASAVIIGDGSTGQVRFDWSLANTTTDIDSSPGPYLGWWWIDYGGGTTLTTPEFEVQFYDHSPRRTTGPCTDWCSTQDVTACFPDVALGSCLSSAVSMASEVLYELSGRTFQGWCQSVIRPCQNSWCWGGPLGQQFLSRGHVVWNDSRGWRGYDDEPCSCGAWLQKIQLPGIAQSIVQVLIGGVVLAPTAYRLDPDNTLIRTDGGAWPICQNMAAKGDQPGAFQVTYQHGYAPNEIARRAAAQLAREFYLACSLQDCALPSGVVEIVRQGIKITRAANLFKDGATGLAMVDSFLAAFRNHEPTYVFSPDTYPTSRRTQ